MDDMPGRFPPPPEAGPPRLENAPPPGDVPQPPGYSPQPTSHYPLDMNRLFELTFSLLRFNWRTFLAMTFFVMIPLSLILAITSLPTSSAANDWLVQVQLLAQGGEFDANTFPWAVLGFGLLVGVLVGIGTWVAQAALTHAALNTYGGAQISTNRSVRVAFSRLVTLAGAYLLSFLATMTIAFVGALVAALLFLTTSSGGRIGPGIGVFLGLIVFVAAIAALIFISIRWTLVVPVIVAEGGGAIKALGRSWRLVSGSSWRVLGYLLAFGLLFGLIGALLTFVLTLAIDPASLSSTSLIRDIDPVRLMLVSFGTGLITALFMPFPAIGMTLLYLDLRWRRGEPVPQPGVAVPSPPVGGSGEAGPG